MNDQQIEQEIQDKGLTAPRVTPADIEANIASEVYFTAEQGYNGSCIDCNGCITGTYPMAHASLSLLTFCVLVLRNGFTVTGESACASPANFDAELGRKIARENAINKVWPLMGYALKERLARGEVTGAPETGGRPAYQQRVIDEKADLDEKRAKLAAFLDSGKADTVGAEERDRLFRQAQAMHAYSLVLEDRISAFG